MSVFLHSSKTLTTKKVSGIRDQVLLQEHAYLLQNTIRPSTNEVVLKKIQRQLWVPHLRIHVYSLSVVMKKDTLTITLTVPQDVQFEKCLKAMEKHGIALNPHNIIISKLKSCLCPLKCRVQRLKVHNRQAHAMASMTEVYGKFHRQKDNSELCTPRLSNQYTQLDCHYIPTFYGYISTANII